MCSCVGRSPVVSDWLDPCLRRGASLRRLVDALSEAALERFADEVAQVRRCDAGEPGLLAAKVRLPPAERRLALSQFALLPAERGLLTRELGHLPRRRIGLPGADPR